MLDPKSKATGSFPNCVSALKYCSLFKRSKELAAVAELTDVFSCQEPFEFPRPVFV